MIDVTIAEVTLTDELQVRRRVAVQGRRAVRPRRRRPRHTSPDAVNPGVPTAAGGRRRAGWRSSQGFTYIINNANFPGGIQAALHLLDTYGNTKVVANPHVAALDNQKATIKVGDRIPINQQTHGRRHRPTRHDDVAVHRHRRAAAGDAAHQRRRAGDARRAGGGQQSRATLRRPARRRRSTRARCRRSSPCRPARRWSWAASSSTRDAEQLRGPAAAVAHPDPRRALRQPDAEEQPHRARAVHHAARGRERGRHPGRHRRPAPQDGEPGRAYPGTPFSARCSRRRRRPGRAVCRRAR